MRSKNCFRASISINKEIFHVGNFKTAIEAARAYNEAAIIAYGSDAQLNNIPGNLAFGVMNNDVPA